MNQAQLEHYLTAFNKRLSERYHKNDDFRLSKAEGRKLNIEARKRIRIAKQNNER